MPTDVALADRRVGLGQPTYIVAEGGINHSGDLGVALQLIRAANAAGADAVKWQKREPEVSVPREQWDVLRETPRWGVLSYIEYRKRLEFGRAEYDAIARECQRLGLSWSASVWDEPSLDFLLAYDPPWVKVPSACLTDIALLEACQRSGKPIILSTGMSTMEQIQRAVQTVSPGRLILLHCTSTYPASPEELNLMGIPALRERFQCPVGFSDHSTGVWAALAGAVLGACVLEKHLTLDRSSWGTDQSASVEPHGLARIVRYVRRWEQAKGDGIKRVYESERSSLQRLRRVP